ARHQRANVERVVADALGDLLARRLGALEEQAAPELAGLRASPPVLSHVLYQVLAELGGADPGAQVVRRIEARVHVGEVALPAVAKAGRLGQPVGVALRRAAVRREPRPE